MQQQNIHNMQNDPSHQMHQQMQDQSGMIMGPSGVMHDPNQQRMMGNVGMASGPHGQQRYSQNPQSIPAHMRRQHTRIDAHGQVIIETDENLSDKEIYPGQTVSQMGK